jgi:hypothetical protein
MRRRSFSRRNEMLSADKSMQEKQTPSIQNTHASNCGRIRPMSVPHRSSFLTDSGNSAVTNFESCHIRNAQRMPIPAQIFLKRHRNANR